ncbi:MAG: hypothetical protein A2600_09645 [Candidatus Lambdaproteobacteria bacterium RIFOXYD1_FULL_56_27]|uniref:Cyclic nucleotide-binding domain-containing protein n=1 Tax=Candidatus Lambdaproteobacteria bacterium RIFOXYD2_FULL_56_26 TaxID=1817773 RepID=A0A1F6GV66_9PROT|nr:MAG: hypothetical protein A2557_04915 [Candidatus Lambdaproteobacteria bacterium RIFOXYD2_FULL_56_26]OGH02308.1 MAG: hypothetical protein A2426_03395 [Candidatus Lambdaproteobacteria bacterium RIFOXYC1_FULL_56_13]OGH10078.1 MAG: hypothetical protein A2600_09645 [Candidatus Lambdaproteobacteria bacterium RIFOXYD1_FULL_56_27]
MNWQYNQYYPLAQAGPNARALGEALLQAYPLTRSCLLVLGPKLVETVQFGYFQAGHEIIKEGEKGKDLYLLCEGGVDVLVGGKIVVNMKGPTLLGDKGIVETDSTRAATIKVAKAQVCLFLKIPMDLFIKDFKSQAADGLFAQETAIFAAMFLTIQDRLFTYMNHQKTMWEEVNSTLNLLNTKLIAKSLENQKPLNWDPNAWGHAKRQVFKLIGFKWPDNLEANPANLYQLLAKFLSTKTAPLKTRLSPAEFTAARQRLWQGWLEEIARGVLKHLPKKALPIDIGEIELFNPKLFRVKLLTLVRTFEKKFPPSEAAQKGLVSLKAEDHFGKGQKVNFLELFPYLEAFDRACKIPRPNWIKAMLAQKTAQIAAKSENEFNGSLVRMQEFLERVKGMTVNLGPAQVEKKLDTAQVNKAAKDLVRSYDAFFRNVEAPVGRRLGEIYFQPDETPRLEDLIKISGSKIIRQQIETAFGSITQALKLVVPNLPVTVMEKMLRIFRASPGDCLNPSELALNYWTPISSGASLVQGKRELFFLKSGTLLGGSAWKNLLDNEKAKALSIKVPPKGENEPPDTYYCFFCLPKSVLPWNHETLDPNQIAGQYTLILQWLTERMLGFLAELAEERDEHYEKWVKAEMITDLEKRVQDFENLPREIDGEAGKALGLYLTELGLTLAPGEPLVSAQVSKSVYNHLVREIKANNPALGVNEVGNQAYTKFRLHLTEMVELIKSYDSNRPKVADKTEVYQVLEDQIRRLFLRLKQPIQESYFSLGLAAKPMISIGSIAKDMETKPDMFRRFAQDFLSLLEQVQINLILETDDYHQKVSQIRSLRSQYDLESLQAQAVNDGVRKLQTLLGPGLS